MSRIPPIGSIGMNFDLSRRRKEQPERAPTKEAAKVQTPSTVETFTEKFKDRFKEAIIGGHLDELL